eukprot:10577298-Alexandrium_andersonii.AAC.1
MRVQDSRGFQALNEGISPCEPAWTAVPFMTNWGASCHCQPRRCLEPYFPEPVNSGVALGSAKAKWLATH